MLHPQDIASREGRLISRINELERRIRMLERGGETPVASGVPASTGQPQRLIVRDNGTTRSLMIKLPYGGGHAWFEATLTLAATD